MIIKNVRTVMRWFYVTLIDNVIKVAHWYAVQVSDTTMVP